MNISHEGWMELPSPQVACLGRGAAFTSWLCGFLEVSGWPLCDAEC